MSRSYRKNPIIKDNGKSKKEMKSLANRKVRRKLNDSDFNISNGKAYKKEFESWDIADFISRWTKEDAIKEYESKSKKYRWFKEEWPTLDDYLNYWEKTMHRK